MSHSTSAAAAIIEPKKRRDPAQKRLRSHEWTRDIAAIFTKLGMYEITQLLESYVRGIGILSGAERTTLFVPALLSGLSQPILIEAGEGTEIPELATLERAVDFANRTKIKDILKPTSPGAPPVVVSSSDASVTLLPLPPIRTFWTSGLWPREFFGGVSHNRRRTDSEEPAAPETPAAWLGLRLPADGRSLAEHLQDADRSREQIIQDPSSWWDWVFSLGGALAGHISHVAAIVADPVSGLPDRLGFQAILSEALQKAQLDKQQFALLLVNPDNFGLINERFGRREGDSLVAEIADRLRGMLRASDPIARYGGVVFAVVLPASDEETAGSVVGKILRLLTSNPYLDGSVRLGFSIGYVLYDPAEDQDVLPVEFLRRADQALNAAKRAGGGCAYEWLRDSGLEKTDGWDRLSGIFTGNTTKDYRNMVLLWDTIDAIAGCAESEVLAQEVVERVYRDLKPTRLGLFLFDEEGELELKRGLTRQAGSDTGQGLEHTVELSAAERSLLGSAMAAGEDKVATVDGDVTANVLPLAAAGKALGGLFLAGPREQLALDGSDRIFLRALAGQVAVALDRARLAEQEARRQESERRELHAQLNQLREAMRRAKLVYQSPQMEEILSRARRVAPTDATVLITGESGTGKELIARTIHEMSPRRDKTLVVVDCVAIASTLIESELFGHEKGAYTGAQGRRVGRLAEADGGTVLLDEIGELPLELQSKLLRFVQERQFTPVGGSKPKRVDVRILAATNRDLKAEVEAGKFREDLYYRLHVVRLEVPALRDRPDDILHLARFFLETFSLQYQKPIRRFTDEAEIAMMGYLWPGNIRELQNRIMQAVILSERSVLGLDELQLDSSQMSSAVPAKAQLRADGSAAAPSEPAVEPARSAWDSLRDSLGREVDATLAGDAALVYPLGRWLQEDLVLEAQAAGDGVTRRGAEILGLPETTFRRRLSKADENSRSGLSPRSGSWEAVRSVLRRLVRSEAPAAGSDLVKDATMMLLAEVLARVPNDTATGSRLLGVTPPTYRNRVAELETAEAQSPSS